MFFLNNNDLSYSIRQLNDEEFNFFRDIVFAESGIKLGDLKRSLLQSRLLRRMRALHLSTYSEYAEYVKDNYDNEIIDFINAVTTNKTEFFREDHHFSYLTKTVLPHFDEVKKDRIRIWSAGCSTGEEPYSIAITLLDYYRLKQPADVKILATDIDTNVLHTAFEGIYKEDQLNTMQNNTIKTYFSKGVGANAGLFKICDKARKLVVFKRLNLLDDVYPMKGKFDAIFCRNVVIYFDKITQKKLFEKFYHYLDDDGFLFVGHSENLSGVTHMFKHLGKTVYKKILSDEAD